MRRSVPPIVAFASTSRRSLYTLASPPKPNHFHPGPQHATCSVSTVLPSRSTP